MNAKDKMTKARIELVLGQPFFGTLALRLPMQEDTSVKTGVCDGSVIRYNPEYVDEMSVAQATGFVAHLIMGPALLHHTRRGDRDIEKWNKASDYAINPILTEAGFELPAGTFNNPAYLNKTVEEIYTLLPPGDDNKNNGDGDGGGGGSDPGGDGGVSDSPNSQNNGASAMDQQAEEQDWKMSVAQAAHQAKQAGKLPASLERLVEELLEPVLPWKDILRRFMTEKAADDFSWTRPNRRFIANGLYLPTRSSEGSGEMVVMIDTSGSLTQDMLSDFGNEVNGIIKDAKPSKTTVIYCDARINKVVSFGPDDEVKLEMVGGGGTDFRPPFDYIRTHNIEPKCAIYFTDGYGPFPEEPMPYPVMWVINSDVTPPWGEHVEFNI
jgi:predicted metal-dependent peptidase